PAYGTITDSKGNLAAFDPKDDLAFLPEAILNSRTDSNGDPEVLVKWEKHSFEEATWENLTSLRLQFLDLDYIGDNDEQDILNDVNFNDVVFDDVSFDDVDFDDVSFDDIEFDVIDFNVRIDDLNFEQELEEVLYYATDDSASISGKSGDVPTWFSDEDVDQGIDVEWKDDSYHSVDEPEEIRGVVPSEVVVEEMVAEGTADGDDGDVIPTNMYDVMVAQEMLKDQDGDVIPVEVVVEDKVAEETDVGSSGEDEDVVIPHEVYVTMVAAEGFLYTKDGDVVIPTEVYDAMVAQEMLEEQTRVIKRRRVTTDKEDKNNAE
ncbi:ty3-gypsy retrotransposon protein, partial [Tanacetum coccineum]